MTEELLPSCAVRLREERIKRLWSQKVMAVRLRAAADEQIRAALPAVDSLQRYVRDYEAGRHVPGDLYAELYCRAFGLTHSVLFGVPNGRSANSVRLDFVPTEHDAWSLTDWIAITNVSDDAIGQIAETAFTLRETHTRRQPLLLLTDVVRMHQQIERLLRSGKQRLRQTRDLYRIDADLLAHAALLLGDLSFGPRASAYGAAAVVYAKESEASPAVALSVQAKSARWQRRYAEAAGIARQGFDCSPASPVRILLASQEANSAAFLGDLRRAREALGRAEIAAGGTMKEDSGVAAWSCPPSRQAMFALSVAIRLGDADSALRSAATADLAWESGDAMVTGVWAQVRLAAAIARVMKGDLDGAEHELFSVLDIAPEYRISTITGYASDLGKRLRQRRFERTPVAARMSERIREFNSARPLARACLGDG